MSSYPTALHNEPLITRADGDTAGTAADIGRNDRQLVDQVLAGDERAFEEIFDRHKRLVAIIAARFFRSHADIEEMVQIGFARAFSELKNFRGRYDRSLASWLVTITSNVCVDTIRSQRRKPERLTCELSESEADSLIESTADHSLKAEKDVVDNDLAEKLLSGLSVDDRLLLQMLYADEMSVAEIADAFGWSSSNVKIRAWRARAALRKILKKYL